MKKIHLFLYFTLFYSIVFSQNIYMNFVNGTHKEFVLSEIKNVTFYGNNMNVNLLNGNIESFDVLEIENYNYKAFSDSEPSPNPNSIKALKTLSAYKFYPNPTKKELNLTFVSKKETNLTIELIDFNGKSISLTSHSSVKGYNKIEISEQIKNLENGIYFCKVTSNGITITEKIIIE